MTSPLAAIGEAIASAVAPIGSASQRTRVLARIAGPIGDAARAATATRVGRGVMPANLDGVHASWLETIDPRAHTPLQRAVDGARLPPAQVWLVRRALAELAIPPMPALSGARRRPSSLAEALALSAAQLREWLVGVGVDQLVFAIGPGAPLDDLVRRSARAANSARRIGEAPRAGQLGPRRAAIARSRGVLDDTLPLRIGARAIAPYVVRQPLARAQLRCRLAIEWGRVVDAELRAHAGDPIEHAPTWAAVAAS